MSDAKLVKLLSKKIDELEAELASEREISLSGVDRKLYLEVVDQRNALFRDNAFLKRKLEEIRKMTEIT